MNDKIEYMQIKKILTAVLCELEENNIPYALVGALAFAYWGHRRYTEDIDFLVKRQDMERVKAIMDKYGYNIYIDTNNATQFIHIKEMVDVDFLYANKETSLNIINQAGKFKTADGLSINVALPEDLIALKLQSISLDPDREYKDMADIQAIIELITPNLDWKRIKKYCNILSMEDYYEKIRKFVK